MFCLKLYMCGNDRLFSEIPLGLGYLKSNCEDKNFLIQVVKKREDLKNCDMIGLSSNACEAKETIEILKTTDIPIIVGGHLTLWNGLTDYSFKHIVRGEGELSLKKILLGEEKNKIVKSEMITDIDTLKFPIRGQCYNRIPILSSRGCPHSCKFCSASKFWGGYRWHSAEYFIDDLWQAYNTQKQENVFILDDLFIANRVRLERIYKIWMKRGFDRQFKVTGSIRSNCFDREAAKMLKDMGFVCLVFGIESASNKILEILGKRTTVEDHQKTIDLACEFELPITASFMHGIPGETMQDIEATKQFIQRNKDKIKVGGWYFFRPFPGIDFYNGESPLTSNMRIRTSRWEERRTPFQKNQIYL